MNRPPSRFGTAHDRHFATGAYRCRANAGVAEMLLAAPEGDEAKDADEGPDADGVLPDDDKKVARAKR